MNLNSLDLNLLVALDALLREANVSRAAMRIGLSQPAASHALQRLRDLVGDPLLVRTGARMELTPRAQALRAPLAQALDQVRSLFIADAFDAARSERRVGKARLPFEGRAAELPLRRQMTLRDRPGAAGPHLLRVQVAPGGDREAGRRARIRQRLQELAQPLGAPEELAGGGDARAAAGDGVQVQHREQSIRSVRRELLPRLDDPRGIRPRPLDRVGRDLRDRMRSKDESRDDPEVPASATAQGPEEIGMPMCVRGHRAPVREHDRRLQQVVAREAELA